MNKKCKTIWIYSVVFWLLSLTGILLFSFSVGRIPLNTVALRQQYWLGAIDDTLYVPGVYVRGLAHQFIRYPSDLQYIVNDGDNALNLITLDRQPIKLAYTVAYRYRTDLLKSTYQNYDSDNVRLLQTAVNNVTMNVISGVLAQEAWHPTTEDLIRAQLHKVITTSNDYSGLEVEAFWLGHMVSSTMEEYFSKSHEYSTDGSTAYRQSQYELSSVQMQASAVAEETRQYLKNTELEVENAKVQAYNNAGFETVVGGFTNALLSPNGSAASVVRLMALRNYPRIVFE